MGIMKKIQRWLRDPRRSPIRRPVNQRSPVPLLTTRTVTADPSKKHAQNSSENKVSEREEIARRMKEMVNRSMELRNAKKVRNLQNVNSYPARDTTPRMARGTNKNPRTNAREQ